MRATAKWSLSVLACPRCLGSLTQGQQVLRCRKCGVYPVLGNAPVLVPEPARWCAAFYESALAALTEVGLADDLSLATLRAFADSMRGEEPQRFGDDWTLEELEGRAPPRLVEGAGGEALDGLVAVSEAQSVRDWLATRVRGECVVELGCGAGVLSEKLSVAKKLVVVDLSLRAVLQASQRSGGLPVVGDAEALPFRANAIDSLVAENVVDLLEAPDAFFAAARRVVRKKGVLLVCSPDPSLGDPEGDDERLAELAEANGFRINEQVDGVPWLRRYSGRRLEVYLVQALSLGGAAGGPLRRSVPSAVGHRVK